MDGTINKAATSVVDSAIVLASSGVFSLETSKGKSELGSLTRVGGLPLFQRMVLTLQSGGICQIWILAGSEEKTLRSLIRDDQRVQAAIRWLPLQEFPPTDPLTWETLASEIKGSCLVVGCHSVFSPSLIQMLRIAGVDGRVLVVVGQPGEGSYAGNPLVSFREKGQFGEQGSSVVFHDRAEPPSEPGIPQRDRGKLPVAGDLIVLPSRLLGISGVLHAHGTNPIRLALEQAAIEGVIQTVPGASYQFRDIRAPNGPQLAERSLLQSLQRLKGGFDGVIDRHVNRKLSGFLTRKFLQVGMSPNMVTMVAMVIGFVSAGFFTMGSYQLGILGALLFQLSVIIDCCDGEVARLTFSESRFGQELDVWSDNVVHMAIFAGIACGSYLHGPWEGSPLPLLLGVIAITANPLSLWLVNRARYFRSKSREGQELGKRDRSRMEFMLNNVANRDFSVVVLLFACLDILGWFLWLAAVGSWFFVIAMGWILRQPLLSRA